MFDDNDSWLAGIGVDVQGIIGSVQQTASAVMEDVKSAGAAAWEQASSAAAAVTGGAPAAKPAAPTPKPAAPSGAPSTNGSSALAIKGSVGAGGKNNPEDVKAVQTALKIAADGNCSPATIEAIKTFQKSIGHKKPDGRIDVGGATAKALAGRGGGPAPATSAAPAAAPTPAPTQGADEDEGFLSGLKKKIVGAVEDGLPGGLPDGAVRAVMPGLPIPGLPGLPGGSPGIGPFPKIPGDGFGQGPGGGFHRPPSVGGGTGGASGIAKTVGEVGQIAMEGIALFDALLVGGLVVVGGGVIVGLGMEVYSSEVIAALPGDVDKVTATMVAGYRTAMQNGPQPGDDAGKAGWLLGNDIFLRMRTELKKKNPDATDEKILAAIAANVDKGAAAAEPILRKKAQEAVWISYASKHQDTRWTSYLNERFRAWSNIFRSAPQGNEPLWKQFINEHSNKSNPLANRGADNDPRSAPGAKQGGPVIDPKTGQPIVAPGTDDNRSVSDPSQVDPAEAPSGGNDDPAEFSKTVLPEDRLNDLPTREDLKTKGDRKLSETEKKEARKIRDVLDAANQKNALLQDVKDDSEADREKKKAERKKNLDEAMATLSGIKKYRLKPMVGSLSDYMETTVVSDEGAGTGASKMRLIFKKDEKTGKFHSVKIIQTHEQK
jgi:hypothetical protein